MELTYYQNVRKNSYFLQTKHNNYYAWFYNEAAINFRSNGSGYSLDTLEGTLTKILTYD